MAEFDFVIVGGGLTGCALAARLAQASPKHTVALFEAGPDASANPLTHTPMGAFMLEKSELDWTYHTEPQPQLRGRCMREVNGHVLGGGSVLNYGGWSRGGAAEYDLWAKTVGDERWSYEKLLPYFKKTEQHFDAAANGAAVGHNGPMRIYSVSASSASRTYPLREPLKAAFAQKGIFLAQGGQGSVMPGLMESVENWDHGKRQPAHLAYDLNGVAVFTESLVERLILDSSLPPRATGIQLANGKQAFARREVIVSAGTYRSPQLLLLSGIGPSSKLAPHGIKQRVDLPAVGENLFDNPTVFQWWRLRHPERGQAAGHPAWNAQPALMAGMPGDWILNDSVPREQLARALEADGAPADHALLDPVDRVHIHTTVMYVPAGADHVGLGLPFDGTHMATSVLQAATTSRGTVSLRSADAGDAPVIDPRHLTTETDRACLRHGMRRIMGVLLDTEAGRDIVEAEAVPPGCTALCAGSSDAQLDERIAKTGLNYKHASGTCAMGRVVDSVCRVKGVAGLRVVDASILPVPIAGWPQASLYAIAERAADMILGREASDRSSP